MSLTLAYPFGSQTVFESIEAALEELKVRGRYGLPKPVSKFEPAKPGCEVSHQKVHYWVTVGDKIIPLRVERMPSRPRRDFLRNLIGPDSIPTLLVYAKMTAQAFLRKVAKCVKLGLDKLRRKLLARIWEHSHSEIAQKARVPDGRKFNLDATEDKEVAKAELFFED